MTLRGGVHRRTATFVLTSADSGASDRPVVYRAYAGETPRLSGGTPVTGWTAVTSADPNWSRIRAPATLYKASIAATSFGGMPGVSPPAELIYNRKVMQLGRWPEPGTWSVATGSGTAIGSATALPAHNWSAAAALAAVNRPWLYISQYGYADQMRRVDAVSGNVFTLDASAGTMEEQSVLYVSNLLEEVTVPGEYWIDRVARVVYFRPPDDLNPAVSGGEAVVSTLDGPIVWMLPGTEGPSHVRFEGITFEASQGDLIAMDGSNNALVGCTFRGAAGNGIMVSGSGPHSIDRSAVYDIAQIGIAAGGDSANLTISNTDIHHVARHLANNGGTGAVLLHGTAHVVRNNKIHNVPQSAIYLNATRSLIELNDLYSTTEVGCDMGAIYIGGTNTGTEIRHNYLHDVPRPPAPWRWGRVAIYLDTDAGAPDTSGYNIHGNIIHRYGDGSPTTNGTGTGVLNKGSNNTFRNNLFVRVDQPYLASYLGTSATVANNQVWITGTAMPAGNVSADPALIDEANGNLANRPDGTTVVGSEVIPFARIGIR